MLDVRPIGYVIGLLVAMLGAAMMVPMVMDIADGNGHWAVFAESGIITLVIGGVIVGVLIMGTVQDVLSLLNVPTFYQYVVRGVILLIAVLLDRLKQRQQ